MKKYRNLLPRFFGSIVLTLWFYTITVSAQTEPIITTFAGGGPYNLPALEASLDGPTGLAFDAAGNLFIVSNGNNRVFKVDPLGMLSVAAGNGNFFGSLFGQFLDGGPATTATLSHPKSVAFDAAGNLFIADTESFRIRRVDATTGTITTVAGSGSIFSPAFAGDGGPATQARLYRPTSLAFDHTGNLYISDSGNNRIRMIMVDADGLIDGDDGEIITTVAGNDTRGFGGDNGPATQASLNFPYALTIDPSGSLYFIDSSNHRIRRIAGGIITTVAGNGSLGSSPDGTQGTAASLWYPSTLVLDAWGNLFFPDQNRIRRVSAGSDGVVNGNDLAETLVTVAGNGTNTTGGDGGPATSAGIVGPRAVAFDGNGNLFIADYFSNIRRVAAGANGQIDGASDPAEIITRVVGNGFASFCGDGYPATQARLRAPYGLAFDAPRKRFYIADSGNFRIRRVDVATGVMITVAGNGIQGFSGDGGPATEARLGGTYFIAVDVYGNLFIADSNNNRIRRVDQVTGIITTVAGNGSAGFEGDEGLATSASIKNPYGLAVDGKGNLYFSDYGNHRIRRVAPGGDGLVTGNDPDEIMTTVVGSGLPGSFGGDGGAGYFASLSSPVGVTVDRAGNLYIADRLNNRVRRVATGADGQITGEIDELITTVVGGGTGGFNGPASAAYFRAPWAMAFDASGNLYISNASIEQVVRVAAGGDGQVTGEADEIITFVAGGCCFNGDNIPATSASLMTPAQLAIDSVGDLYIADASNDRIRKINLSNTPEGSNVTVELPQVSVTFETVVSSGETTMTTSGTGTPPPQGFKLGTPPVYFMLETTAEYSGSIQVCIDYGGISYGNEEKIRLFHQSGTAWEDVTAAGYPDTVNQIICGTVNSFSEFAVFETDYIFEGFLPPLGNPPVLNAAKSGQAVPVKWKLIDGSGSYLSNLDAVTGVWYQPMACNGMLETPITDAETSGRSGLHYDIASNQFVFTWKTNESMAGSCYHFILEIYGFDRYQSDFKLK